MDPTESIDIAVFTMFAAISFMGAWDGLLRHHIRIRVSEQYPFSLTLTGAPAFSVGGVCLLFLLIISRMASGAIPALVAGCETPICALGRMLLPPFTNWLAVLTLIIVLAVLIPWARGMFDGDGPFRTRMLAPGVWYRERDIVTLIQTSAHEHKYDEVDIELILHLADAILGAFHGVSPSMPSPGSTAQPPTHEMVIGGMRNTFAARIMHKVPRAKGAIIIDVITMYTITKLEAAERRWPWRRRFLELFP